MSKSKPIKGKRRLKPLNEVQLFQAAPNPMFPDWMTERLRFLRYQEPVQCAYCGKLNRHHWTMFLSFRIGEGFEKKVRGKVIPCGALVGTNGKEIFPPLTPVCRKHILSPIV